MIPFLQPYWHNGRQIVGLYYTPTERQLRNLRKHCAARSWDWLYRMVPP